jgi:hypothetical protein
MYQNNMNYKISIFIENEEGDIICDLSTEAGMQDFEENVVRKAQHSIDDYEARQEVRMQNEIDRQKEDAEYGLEEHYADDGNGNKVLIDKEANTTEPY